MGGRGNSSDSHQFTLDVTANVQISLTGLRTDLDLRVYDSAGELVGSSRRPGASSESLAGELEAGTYTIWVYAATYSGASSYELDITIESTNSTPNSSAGQSPSTSTSTESAATTDPTAAFADVAYYGSSDDWSVNSINAPEAWAQGYAGKGVVVAIVDSGVDLDHIDLDTNIWTNSDEIAGNGRDDDQNGYVDDVHGWDFAYDDNNPDDTNGHGTHLAGIVAAERNGSGATGVAYDATIMPVQVLDSRGSGTMWDVAAGIRYGVDNGADIINLSLGGAADQTIRSALAYALQHDVLVVCAAGNYGMSMPDYPASYTASLANVISVGAYNSAGSLASFSSRVGRSGAVQVNAPGVSISSAATRN